eukprot:TRINITY_DN298_c0_g2_i4.p1 TRINITY_DN298_c0_g2~~TRINITY_DN298_c0_g2_i4.p1  ORF type:complete len:158 (-),score=50.37 TRINITY_DN298_c0_g2_i4:63-536(-)
MKPVYGPMDTGAPQSQGFAPQSQGFAPPQSQGGYGEQSSYGAPQSQGLAPPPSQGGYGGQSSYGAPQSQGLAPPPSQGGHSAYGAPQHHAGPPPVARSTAPAAKQATALYPFEAQSELELSFQYGEVLNILSTDGDWWQAELRGKRGLVPGNYVQLV